MNLASKLRARIVKDHGRCLLTDDELVRMFEREGGRSDSSDEIERWYRGQLRADSTPAPAPVMRTDGDSAAPADAKPGPPVKRRDPVREAWDSSWRSDATNPTDHTAEVNAASSHAIAADRQRYLNEAAERERQSGRVDPVRAAYDASFAESARRATAAGRVEVERDSGGAAAKDPVAEAYRASWK